MQTRRYFAKVMAASAMVAGAQTKPGGTLARPNSKWGGVQIGVISYSFRALPADQILAAIINCGLSEVELMSNHAESLVGAPPQGVFTSGPNTAQFGQAELEKWRKSVSMDRFKDLRKSFDLAGVDIRLLCYNLRKGCSDDEIDYAFQMAQALGAKAISSTAQMATAKRVAPFADKHKMMWGGHGHDNTTDPEEFSTPESFEKIMSFGNYMGVNLDIGHFTAANYDPIDYIQKHHARITNLHLKDRKKNHGDNLLWGQGDTPIKPVLQLLKKEKYNIPANVEYEYKGKDDPITEVSRCAQFCKEALA